MYFYTIKYVLHYFSGMLSNKSLFFIVFFLFPPALFSQEIYKDTLTITLIQADSSFLRQNLSLLAEKCNVDAANAQIIQAKLFTNPSLSVNQLVYNTEHKENGGRKWFDYSSTGETSAQLQKLFLLAGKHNKQIRMAELSANREAQNYFDLLRSLKYSLRSNFYNIFYLEKVLNVYEGEIASMNKLIQASREQFEKGFISKKELLRLESALFTLENEKSSFTSQLISCLGDFNLLLHSSNIYYRPVPGPASSAGEPPALPPLKLLIDTAYENRYDMKMAQTDLKLSQLNLDYQKARSVPDISLSAGWDRNGSYVNNYNFIGLQFDLPFFDRNQGNIQSARASIESNRYRFQSAREQVMADVIQAYSNALEINRLYGNFDRKFMPEFDRLREEMMLNFEKKNISLVEFLDYYDAYKSNAVQFNLLEFNRMAALENINFTVGKDMVK